MSPHPLRVLLDAAARGVFPPSDGLIDVVPSPGGLADAVVGLTGHFMLAADIDSCLTRSPAPASANLACTARFVAR